jgi:hypothetical protein
MFTFFQELEKHVFKTKTIRQIKRETDYDQDGQTDASFVSSFLAPPLVVKTPGPLLRLISWLPPKKTLINKTHQRLFLLP